MSGFVSPENATILTTNSVASMLASHRDAWGDRHFARGVDQLVEESSELLKALMKHRRDAGTVAGSAHKAAILDEVADVCICLELVAQHLGITRQELLAHASRKADALQVRLELGTADPRIGKASEARNKRAAAVEGPRCRVCNQLRSECCC